MSFDQRAATLAAIRAARQNIALIVTWAGEKTLAQLREDLILRYAVERAFIAIDAAVKDIPAQFSERFGLPVRLIAGFRNALAHAYEDIIDERVLLTIKEDLPALDAQLAEMEKAV
jgi:uncharacterized protein with HEPN domain